MAETVLLADANPTMQRVVELTCAEEGLKVVSVSDGEQALDYLATARPGVALISMTLQKLDGLEIAGLVRDRPDLQGIPVLLLAGAFETFDEARVRASGAAGVLVKPYEPGLVIKRVKELLGMSKLEGDPPAPEASTPSHTGRLLTDTIAPPHDAGPDRAASAPPGDHPASVGAGAWSELREASGPGRDEETGSHDGLAAPGSGSGVDEDWSGTDAASSVSLAELTGGESAAGERAGPLGADAAESRSGDRWAIEWPALLEDGPVSGAEGASPEAEPGRPPAIEDFTPPMASALAREQVQATYGDVSPPALGFPAADAFAMLWAHEQGEPLPPVPPPPPVELSEQTVQAVAARTTDQLTDRVTSDLATRVIDGLTGRVTDDLAGRLTTHLTLQFGDAFAERVTAGLASRLTDALADRVADRLVQELGSRITEGVSERLSVALTARLSAGLAEQIAAHVTERTMQQAFGESLRQTVHDVSERLVREEIARIRAAAKE